MNFPEHEKLEKVADKSQAIGEFLEDLGSRGILLAFWVDDEDRLAPVHTRKDVLLAQFFDIDLVKLEAEKRAMLESLRTPTS